MDEILDIKESLIGMRFFAGFVLGDKKSFMLVYGKANQAETALSITGLRKLANVLEEDLINKLAI